ncbi:CoA transferase [Nocardia sp. NPDC047038]|uniref:CaiB/BaiF CoA-transferase family protein n=1 Tax=Nocardia sp. NPDC047038 TaxID=3154338 RepID=UPI0033CB7FAE
MAAEVCKPLAGMLVVEAGDRPAVSACGSLLRDLGARVVVAEDESSATAATRPVRLAGKESVRATAMAIEQLLDVADVAITSSDTTATVAFPERRATQVRCDITAFGGSGPLSGIAASEALVQAWAGTAEVTGRRDGPPLVTPAPLLEMEAGAYAAAAVLAAIRVLRRHGIGQEIDIALYDVGVNALAAFLPLAFAGREASRDGNRHAILAPWNSYPTRDGWVMVCAPTDDQWRRLCDVVGKPGAAESLDLATSGGRLEHLEQIDLIVSAWTRDRTVAKCLDALAAAGIPSGPIIDINDLEHEPNLRHRGTVVRATDPQNSVGVLVPGPLLGERVQVAPVIPSFGATKRLAERNRAPRRGTVDRTITFGGFPLAGIRVIEIGMNTVAPLAGRQLGALGADVIKIEPPTGDVNRSNAPFRQDAGTYIFAVSNTDKRGIVLNLRDPEDARTLHALLSTADVLIENLKPGSLDRLGFSAENLRREHPGLVYCSMTGFGHDSVYKGRPALDTVVQAMSGMMAATRQDGMPTKAGISVADQLGGQLGLVAVLGALLAHDADGSGARLDIAMQDATVWAGQHIWNGASPEPCEIIGAADGYVAVVGLDRAHIAALLGVREDELGATTRALTRDEFIAAVDPTLTRIAPVRTVVEVIEADQTAARGLLVSRPTIDGDAWTVLESPLRLAATPARVRTAMPRLGVIDIALHAELTAAHATSAERAGMRAGT